MNKPRPKNISASRPSDRWQADLIEMRKEAVTANGQTYKYVLEVLDDYSRFLITRPLVSKTARNVSHALQDIIYQHGPPRVLQTDRGTEFQADVRLLCATYNIKMINSSPYHPQSQGKCERANRTLKNKIRAASLQTNGFNWVKGLPELTSIINKTPKRILGNRTPFDVYYARGHIYLNTRHSRPRHADKHLKELAKNAHSKVVSKAEGKVSGYRIGESVFIRYPYMRSRVPKKRHIVEGKIMDKKQDGYKYFVSFVTPEGCQIQDWVGVENITSKTVRREITKQNVADQRRQSAAQQRGSEGQKRGSEGQQKESEGQQKGSEGQQRGNRGQQKGSESQQQRRSEINEHARQKKEHRNKFYKVLNHNVKIKQLKFAEDVTVIHDPPPDGNCQFNAIAHKFSRHNILTDHIKLRGIAVKHISSHRKDYANFVVGDISAFIDEMQKLVHMVII